MTLEHQPSVTRPKVLTVDDVSANNELIEGMLAEDYEVTQALSGEACLFEVQKDPPDLILLDVMMPEMNGFEVCRRLKASPETRMIPVLFVTVRTNSHEIVQGLELGAVDYLRKPFNQAELKARLRNILRMTRAQHALAQALQIQQSINTALTHEIQERQRIEAALRHNEYSLQKAQEMAHLGHWTLDLQAAPKLHLSAECQRLLGGSPESPIVEWPQFLACIHPQDRERVEQAIQQALAQGRGYRLDHRLNHPSIRLVTHEAEILFDDQGQPQSLRGILQDITEAQHATALQAAYARQNTILEEERARLAQDLHDDALQIFGLMERHLKQNPQPDHTLLQLISTGRQKIRQVIQDLHPPMLHDLGLVEALRAYILDLNTRLNCQIEFEAGVLAPHWPHEILLTVYRIAQEALNNWLKHAQTSLAQVLLGQRGPLLWLQVEDDGCGFDPQSLLFLPKPSSYGLFFMRERAQQVGGTLAIQSEPGAGTTILLEVPFPPNAQNAH